MKKRNVITAIDVGTTKVCTIVADISNGGTPRVVGLGITPSRGMHKALVVNINEAKDAIRDSVRKAEQTSNFRIESAYIGVTGRHVTSSNNRGVVSINRGDRMVRSEDLRRVLNSAQSVKTSSDRKLIHVIPRSYTVDGQEGVKNPVGMYGYRLDVETHVITAAVTSIQNLVKCIRGVGVDVEDLVLEPLASSEAILTEDEKQAGIVLADIGGGTTDISIFREGSIWHTAVLPVAGYQLTRDIAIGLGLPFDIAEEMKKKYGSVLPVPRNNGNQENTEAVMLSQDGHGVSYQDLCDILRARIEEVLKLIMLEMPGNEYETLTPAGLVLTGGSSNLAGLATLGNNLLHVPVKIGAPINLVGIAESLRDPAYATSVGLLLWGARHGSNKSWKTGLFGGGLKRLATQIVRLFR